MTTTSHATSLSRRQFLKGGLSAMAAFGIGGSHFPLWPLSSMPRQVPIPPSLMLHSPDGRGDFLPPLLEQLNRAGYTALTYQEWRSCILEERLPLKPVVLSIDDLALTRVGSGAFQIFAKMQAEIAAAGMSAVFGVITEPVIGEAPQREQASELWDAAATWVSAGFELATHTSYHSNFNARDTGPRPDFGRADYEAEICRSAGLIEAYLAARGIEYAVQSLILPYGSGYAYNLEPACIHAGIVEACRQTAIQTVIGIPQGRRPLSGQAFVDGESVVYVGRFPPAYQVDVDGHTQPDVGVTFARFESWYRMHYAGQWGERRLRAV